MGDGEFGEQEARAFDLGNHAVEWDEVTGSWSLYWWHGWMRLRWFRSDDRENAEKVARLFGFLYSKGVPCELARDVASDHVYVESGWYRSLRERAKSLDWRPIETAPKDGSTVLAWDGTTYALASRIDDGRTIGWLTPSGAFYPEDDPPTHWHPLPPPPESG